MKVDPVLLNLTCCISNQQVFRGDIIELDADDDPNGVAVIGENASDQANKQAVSTHTDWQSHAKSNVPDNSAGPSAIPATNVSPWDVMGDFHQNAAGPSAIPATNVYQWDGFHQNVAGPSAILAGNFYPWDGLGAYHGATVTPPVYFDQYVAASGGGSYAFNKGEANNYYNYNNLLMEGGGNFSLNANYFTETAPVLGTFLPLGHMTSPEMPHQPSQTKIANNETDEKYNTFKQFDTVGDHSDHFYTRPGNGKALTVKKPSKNWVKRIQHEWKVLEKDLPETIFVRVYEERMDLLRAVIIGPAGTPYHDGLFFFDVQFPSQYPSKPPHFEDFVVGHFRKYGCKLLRGCKAYMDGAQVGCLVGDGVQDVDEGDKSCSNEFKVSLKILFVGLRTEFTNIGVDCTEFQNCGATIATADTTLKL
ncbi:hypothetical protein PR202_ga10152 [Eleusine coracana subsp. coracana]|uniref:UBC core domain-containing protein n=1 Tax=Eleusine coracana subsp. coracana TaxID=191504 RepID=A0AAV5C5Z1_ELECO|nr:hypothetical protein PR202_ga10152 [Eleusine coracana subsp. coracana]